MKPTMTLSILALLVMTTGCATAKDFLVPHYTTFCYVDGKADQIARETDYHQCMLGAIKPQQQASCMYLRGYKLAVCDAKTGEFIRYE